MTQRIAVLTGYLLRRQSFSLAGIITIILALVYWAILFPPGQGTPDVAYYVVVIGVLGPVLTFLVTLTITARANRAVHYPLVVRLPSRVEYLTAVFLSAVVFTTIIQLLIALLSLFRGPQIPFGRMLEIPPIWLATNILAAVLALHASDFVTAGWSRTYIYGILAIFLLGQSANNTLGTWLAARMNSFSYFTLNQGWLGIGNTLSTLANWMGNRGPDGIAGFFGFIFWPFSAMADATVNGFFDPTQALAPAIILLYATILFMLAADLFATKDLDFTE